MEVQYRARRSFEKPHVEAPPRLQVIGFNVSPKAEAAALPGPIEGMEIASCARASYNELSPSPLPKPASSPRSALQQLLLHQSPPSTSPSSSNHCLPPLLPPSSSSPSANQTLITAGSPTSHKPASSSPSSNQNLTNGFLQPAAANHKWTNDGLLHPSAANEKWSSAGVSRPQSPPAASAYQSNSSIGHLKSILQLACTSSDIHANQSSRASILSSLVQSQCASSSASGGSQTMISKQMINQQNPKALIKDNYEAFFQIKQTSHAGNPDVTAREIKGRLISTNKVINESPYAVKSKKSSWIHDEDDQPSAGKYKKSSWKGYNEHPLGNEKSRKSSCSEEKSKKSSLFMFAASSPAPEAHHQHHSGEHNIAFKDMDFLSSCHLCRRFLGQGQDVFMYSGDKAFCSMECRYQQIVIDERKERCPPAIIRSGASPVYQHISVTASSTHHPITINKPHFINTAAAA